MVFGPMDTLGTAKPSRAARVGERDHEQGEDESKGLLPPMPTPHIYTLQATLLLSGWVLSFHVKYQLNKGFCLKKIGLTTAGFNTC